MKIRTGRYKQQLSFGITVTNYHKQFKALIIDFAFWYVEIIFKDYKE